MRIFYATDIHGSELCFRKFIRAAHFYDVEVLFFGGDYTSKKLLFVVRHNNHWRVELDGRTVCLDTIEEVNQFRSDSANKGLLTRIVSLEEFKAIQGDEKLKNVAYEEEMRSTLERWSAFANESFKLSDLRIITIPGNDEPAFADEYFTSEPFIPLDKRHVYLDEGFSVLGLGGSNITPWNTYREYSEEELKQLLEATWSPSHNGPSVILFAHVPPWNSGLDSAPKIKPDLSYDLAVGQVQLVPVGSKALREFITEHQPTLGLFGHVHEAARHNYIGKTLCLNPGSYYSMGILRGCILTLKAGKVAGYQFTEG